MRLFISLLLLASVIGCAGKTIIVHDRTTGIQIEIREDQLDKFLTLSNRQLIVSRVEELTPITDDTLME